MSVFESWFFFFKYLLEYNVDDPFQTRICFYWQRKHALRRRDHVVRANVVDHCLAFLLDLLKDTNRYCLVTCRIIIFQKSTSILTSSDD